MGITEVWIPEIRPRSPKSQSRYDRMLKWNQDHEDLVKAYVDQFQLPEHLLKYQEDLFDGRIEIQPPGIVTSAPTCVTEVEDIMNNKQLLAKEDLATEGSLLKSPREYLGDSAAASGNANEVPGGSLLKRPHDDLDDSSGGSLLKSPDDYLGDPAAASGVTNEVPGGSLLKRPRDDLGTSSDQESMLNRHCEDLGESVGAASGDN